jgi:FHS family Na+ dependent glucose MFS transporter 1
LTPTIPLLWLLIAVLLLMGIGEGVLDVGGNTLLVWVHRRKVGPFMNALHFFFGAGAFIAPIIIAQAVKMSGDIHWAYWILALLILPVSLWLLRLPSPTAQTISKDDPAGQVNHLLVALIVLFFFLYVGAEVSFGGWVFTYAVTLELTTETFAAYLTSAFWGSLTVGRLLAIPIALAKLVNRGMAGRVWPGFFDGLHFSHYAQPGRAPDDHYRASDELVFCGGQHRRDVSALVYWATV